MDAIVNAAHERDFLRYCGRCGQTHAEKPFTGISCPRIILLLLSLTVVKFMNKCDHYFAPLECPAIYGGDGSNRGFPAAA